MKSVSRIAAASILAAAAFLISAPAAQAHNLPLVNTGSAAPEAAGPNGPFERLSSCEARGNQGMANGEWDDYDCVGGPGAWFVQPK